MGLSRPAGTTHLFGGPCVNTIRPCPNPDVAHAGLTEQVFKMNRNFSKLASLAALSLLALSTSSARADYVVVSFTALPDALGIPLSPWLTVGLALLLMVVAHRKLHGHARFFSLLAGVSVVLGATYHAQGGLPNANAAGPVYPTTFNLTLPSPTQSPDIAWDTDVSVVNATGQTVRIDRVMTPSFFFSLTNPRQGLKCQGPNVVLPPGASCNIRLLLGA